MANDKIQEMIEELQQIKVLEIALLEHLANLEAAERQGTGLSHKEIPFPDNIHSMSVFWQTGIRIWIINKVWTRNRSLTECDRLRVITNLSECNSETYVHLCTDQGMNMWQKTKYIKWLKRPQKQSIDE